MEERYQKDISEQLEKLQTTLLRKLEKRSRRLAHVSAGIFVLMGVSTAVFAGIYHGVYSNDILISLGFVAFICLLAALNILLLAHK